MRPFFRRPSWARNGGEDLACDFYRRSKQTYSDIVAENREARERSTVSIDATPVEHGKAIKRRRVSNESCVKSGIFTSPLDENDDTAHGAISSQESSNAWSKHDVQVGLLRANQSALEVKVPTVAEVTSQSTAGVVPNCDTSRCNESAGSEKHKSQSPGPLLSGHAEISDSHMSYCGDAQSQSSIDRHRISQSPEFIQEDTVVQILITSEIENTKPLIVRRKMSQGLRDVRLAWCKRQNLPEELHSSVILTWKGRRLFDVTTCKSLGIDTEHNFADVPGMDDNDDINLRIHMEAVMEDIFNKRRTLPDTKDNADSKSEEVEPGKQGTLIRVVLKCPELDDFKIKARPKTHISRLIAAFRDAQHISTERHVYLLFDGDRLDPDTCLEDHDIADLDLVDVQIK